MLDVYISSGPTVTERLAFPMPGEDEDESIFKKVEATRKFLDKWQMSWGKKG